MELLGTEIFRNALIAGTIVALITAPVSYFLVLRAHAFASEALTDVGFAGATGAALLGWGSIIGMVALSVAAAIGLGALSERIRGRDVEVGMVLSFALGLGVLFLSLFAHSSGLHASAGVNILFGSLLSVGPLDLYIELGIGAVVAAALAVIFRPLLFATIDPVVAEARGVPLKLLSMIFMALLGVTAASCMLVVGILLVAALLVAPGAAAVNLTNRPTHSLLLTTVISLGAVWGGLALAFFPLFRVHLPVGFTVSTLVAAAYLVSILPRREAPRALEVGHPNREVHGG